MIRQIWEYKFLHDLNVAEFTAEVEKLGQQSWELVHFTASATVDHVIVLAVFKRMGYAK